MAQLKDSLITGDLRVTGKIYGLVNIDASQVVSGTLPVTRGGTGATTFTSGNVLVGAGTEAITTIAKTNANTANTLVQRDASGNFSAGTITASLSGNASTATKLNSTGTTAQFWRGDNAWSDTISGGLLKITNNSTTLSLGAANTSWVHFTNSAGYLYYFDKQINAVGGFKVYNTSTALTDNSLVFSQGGGWSMSDATWIRTVGNKNVYQNSGIIRTDGTLQVGSSGAYFNSSSSGTTISPRLTMSSGKPINQILTGSGTAASDKGSGVSPRYFPARWTFNAGVTATDGDIFTIKIPVAGHDYGVFMSVNNGTNYYPVVANGTGRITTHYPVNTYIQVVFEASGSAASMYALDGSDARATVTGGVFRIINYYDANTDVRPASYCTTAAATAAKVASHSAFVLKANSYTLVTMQYANSAQSAITLNINGTGAKPIYIDGVASSASNYTLPAGTYLVFYNGTNYYFRTDAGIQGGTWFGYVGSGSHTAVVNANEFSLPVGSIATVGNVSNTSMTHSNNANAEMIIKTHPTSGTNYYEARLGFSSNGSLYYMPVNTTTWKTVAYTDSNITGTASKATAANLTTTANAIAYYTNTTGTFGTKASANGALYATSANGALSWGTLPIAQGGTGKTTAADAWTALGGGASGKHADSYFALSGHNHDSTYLKLSGGTMTGQLKTSFNSAVAMGSYGASATTVPNLCTELRYSSGAAGSANITTAYTLNGITIPTGWYNFLWIPHRSGGANGAASGDNCNYGTLLLTGMTTSNAYRIQYNTSAIATLRSLDNITWGTSAPSGGTNGDIYLMYGSAAANWTTIWTGTLQGGNTLSLALSSYNRIKIYYMNYSVQGQFEIDLTQTSPNAPASGYTYGGGGCTTIFNSSSKIEHHVCEAFVNTGKTTFYNYFQGYARDGSTNNRNNTAGYYIYRIEAK